MTGAEDADLAQLADDYVVGLLGEVEGRLFEELMLRDPALAQRVGMLRDRLLPLDLSAPAADLPEGLIDRLRDRIAAEPQTVQPATQRLTANLPNAPRRAVWALLAACVLGVALGFGAGWMRPLPEPRVVAVLVDADGVPQAVIEDYGNATAQVRFVADVEVPPDRTLQAWTLPSPEIGATSLGTLDRVGPALLRGPDLPEPAEAQLYEITIEPLGGSPTGRPTGPILGKGLAAVQG